MAFGAYDQLTEENTIHDPYRISYLRQHIEQLEKAVIEDGVPVLGYTRLGNHRYRRFRQRRNGETLTA